MRTRDARWAVWLLLSAGCAEDRECSTDGDCMLGQICSALGECVGAPPPVNRRDLGQIDFGDAGDAGDVGGPDMDMADAGDAGDVGPDSGMDMDMGGAGMDMADLGDMGPSGMVGPIVAVPALSILTQDVILEVERRTELGSGSLTTRPGARIDPASRSCTNSLSAPMMGANGQRCVILQRDCDGPGSALPTGNAQHRFTINGMPQTPIAQGPSAGPTWSIVPLTPLFMGPNGVDLDMSTTGAAGGLVSIPSTRVPTPADFRATTPDPRMPGSLDLTVISQITFSTTNGIGEDLFFELFDENRTRVLRCEVPVTGVFFPIDPGALQDYQDTLDRTADVAYFAEIGFRQAVTREVPVAGGGSVEVGFSFKWVSRYIQVAPGI